MPNPTVSSSESLPTSSRLARSFKGVRQLWTPRNASQTASYAKGSPAPAVAMTLTTDFRPCPETQTVTLLHPNLEFLPHCGQLGWNSTKAFVHYEPSQSHVALGANADMKHTNTLWLTVEQYAWLIQQLQEEKGVHEAVKAIRSESYSTSTAITAWGAFIHPCSAPAPVLGVLNAQLCSRTFLRRFSRLLYRTKHRSIPEIYRQCIFMLPKSLLLQAAVHIPMTKPLPPLATSPKPRQVFKKPFQEVPADLYDHVRRYGVLAAKTVHAIIPESIDAERSFCKLVCRKCQSILGLDAAVLSPSSLMPASAISCGLSTINAEDHHEGIPAITVSQSENIDRDLFENTRVVPTFPLSYLQNIWTPDSCISATEHHQRNGSAVSDGNSEGSSPVTSFSLDQKPERHGYIAVDHQHEEIVVVFPGVSSSKALFENASFVPAPWQDIEAADDAMFDEYGPKPDRRSLSTTFKRRTWTRSSIRNASNQDLQHQQEDSTFWVLDCALAAWRRCELTVATRLMRTCQMVPAHYKVVIIGHSLGGAVAALCASSLVSTKLLVNRSILFCAIHSPRVGNRAFVEHLEKHVETIRVTHPSDLMAHIPPRTAGLFHTGATCVLIPPFDSSPQGLYRRGIMLKEENPSKMEDTLARTFTSTTFNISMHYSMWDIDLNPDTCVEPKTLKLP
ncbi:hypothetical protein EC973_006130 [Apophysomyces ossiformis]|uniref:Fungal lipase-type domain-containing protein n=1 Tax=Apophysomyces ossiformis TaxID=679940 RepID=A0A8H7BWB8_9FUNG|nr:hypothetical protein EC973_006130 [Apophysomyces ossiformis]